MKWEATDQFGNLYRGESQSTDVESLRPEIADLLVQLRERAGGPFTVTIDTEYGELNGPDPDQVAYVLLVPWLMGGEAGPVVDAVEAAAAEQGIEGVSVHAL